MDCSLELFHFDPSAFPSQPLFGPNCVDAHDPENKKGTQQRHLNARVACTVETSYYVTHAELEIVVVHTHTHTHTHTLARLYSIGGGAWKRDVLKEMLKDS